MYFLMKNNIKKINKGNSFRLSLSYVSLEFSIFNLNLLSNTLDMFNKNKCQLGCPSLMSIHKRQLFQHGHNLLYLLAIFFLYPGIYG